MLKMLTDVYVLPLPCASDPFALRWFADTEFAADATNSPEDCARFHAAELTLKRLLLPEHYACMSALEV